MVPVNLRAEFTVFYTVNGSQRVDAAVDSDFLYQSLGHIHSPREVRHTQLPAAKPWRRGSLSIGPDNGSSSAGGYPCVTRSVTLKVYDVDKRSHVSTLYFYVSSKR